MLKVTIKLAVLLLILVACNENVQYKDPDPSYKMADSVAETRIDSANAAIRDSCDSAVKKLVPRFADSLLTGDTAFMLQYFSSQPLFTDSNIKVQNVVRKLKEDCDSNLQKETYKLARRLRLSKPKLYRH